MSNSALSENELNNGITPIYSHKLIALFLLIIAFGTAQILVHSAADESRFWPGWFTAVLPAGSDVATLTSQLTETGVDNPVSSSNSSVEYMSIPDIQSVPVEDLDSVLLPGDPRRDPWLSSVSRLFQSGDGRSLIYLPADRSVRAYEKMLDGMGLGAIKMADKRDRGGFPSVLLYLTAAAGITVFIRKDRFSRGLLITASLFWLPYVFYAPYGVLPFVLLVFLAGGLDHRGNLFRQIGGIGSLVLALLPLVLGFSFPGSIAISLIPASATILFSLLMPSSVRRLPVVELQPRPAARITKTRQVRKRLTLKKREHQLFEPVSLTDTMNRHVRHHESQKARRTEKISFQPLGALLIVFMAFTVLTIVSPGILRATEDALFVPASGESVSDFDSISGLHRLEEQRNAGSLPDIAQMIASRAYQESFLYGGRFGLPVPGETLVLADYVESGNMLVQEDRLIATYDKAWYSDLLDSSGTGGIGSLLASSGGPAEVSLVDAAAAVPGAMSTSRQVFYLIASLTLALILVITPSRITLVSRGAYSPLSSVRRRAQAA